MEHVVKLGPLHHLHMLFLLLPVHFRLLPLLLFRSLDFRWRGTRFGRCQPCERDHLIVLVTLVYKRTIAFRASVPLVGFAHDTFTGAGCTACSAVFA